MQIITLDPADRRQVRQFLELPFRLYRDVPQWVPPMQADARRQADRRRNPFFQHSAGEFFLALGADGRAAGRLAALDNRGYNEFNGERTAFFYLFECEHDREAAGRLFEAAFAWARQRGLQRCFGPKGFSVFDGVGLLVKGFEHRPAFGLPYNLPYYPELIEAAGFQPAGDTVSGYLSTSTEIPEKIERLAELVKKRRGLRVEPCATRADLRHVIPHLQKLYNDVLGQMARGAPLTDAEVHSLADHMLWFADPALIKIVVKEPAQPGQPAEPVGFLLAYPDVSAAMQRSGGRLFPFGWLHLLLEARRTEWVNVNGAGILPEYQGLGGTAILFSEMARSVKSRRFRHADLVQIATDNDKMQRELRDLGIDFYKTHRMYARDL